MPAFHFVHPGDLSTRTGGYRYARELLAAMARRGIAATVHRLSDAFPFPDGPALAHAQRVLGAIADESLVVVDGLALGAMPAQAAAHAARLKLVALVHHPLALESGLSEDEAARLAISERAALSSVRAVVVTSPATAAALRDYDVPVDRLTVVLPGTDRVRDTRSAKATAPAAIEPAASAPVRLLCVASLTPRKGHLDLLDALAACRARNPGLAWRLLCVGSLERDPACAGALRDRIAALGLGEWVCLAGERDEAGVARCYAQADVFVLASHHEGYGMVLAEAMAHGVPIVSTTAGAIPDTVPAGAGILVPPGDVDALAFAIGKVMAEPSLREAMAASARRAASELPDWDMAAERFAGVLQSLSQESMRTMPDQEPDQQPDHEPDQQPHQRTVQELDLPPDPLTFSASWLALREPHDHASRAGELTAQLRRFLLAQPPSATGEPIQVLDLACGSGSSLRYLAPRIGGSQYWKMIDRDAALLALLPATWHPQVRTEPICLDLADGLCDLPLDGIDLITASALLDLVSADWLDRLLAAVIAAGLRRSPGAGPPALLFALSYDGWVNWQPALPDDAWAVALFNRHQRSDKGFGPALGPDAAVEACRCIEAAGFTVAQAASPWHLTAADTAIQRELLAGMASAAAATSGSASARVSAWLAQRRALVDAGLSSVAVGHRDLLALPERPSGR